MNILTRPPKTLGEDDLDLCEAIAAQVGLSVRNAMLFDTKVRTERALLESEERYRTLFEESPISLWDEDFSDVKRHIDALRNSGIRDLRQYLEDHPETVAHCASLVKITGVNNATLRLYDALSLEEFIGGLPAIFGEATYGVFKEELLSLFEGKTTFESEATNQTFAGENKHVLIRSTVVPGYEETLSKVLISIVDITALKKTENALRESEAKYRRLSENSPAVVYQFMMTPDGSFTYPYLNETVKDLFGVSPEEAMKDPSKLLAMIHPEDQQSFRKTVTESAASLSEYNEVIRCLKDDSIVWIEAHSVPKRQPDGSVVWDGFFLDITGRKQAEDALHASEAEKQAILDASIDMIMLVDTELRIVWANKTAIETINVDPENLVGRTCHKAFQNSEQPCLGCPTVEAIASGRPQHKIMYQPAMNTVGESYWEDYCIPIRDQSGQVCQAVEIARNITDQKKSEQALRDSEQRMKAVLDNSPIAIWCFDGEKYSYLSKEWYRFTGQDPTLPLTVDRWVERVHPDDLEKSSAIWKEHWNNKTSHYNDFRLMGKDGKYRDIHCLAVPVFDDEGRFLHFQGFNVDVTEQKKAEDTLRESEEKFRSLVDQAAEMLFLHDLKGNLIDVNLAAVTNTGYTREELRKMSVFDIDPDAHDRNDMRNYWETLKLEDPPATFEVYHKRKDGSIYPAEVVASKIVLHDSHYILGLARDITERVTAEEARRKSEQEHRHILKTAMDGFCVVGLKGRLIEVNEAYCQMSGYTEEELLSMSVWHLIADENENDVAFRLEKLIQGGEDRFESVHRRKDGTRYDVEVSAQCSSIDGGRFIAFMRDITESKEMEARLRQAQKMESIGNLAGGIAHDFNNLLFPIIGMSELLLEDLPSGSLVRENAAQILKAGKRGSDLVKQILAFSRQSEKKMIPTRIQQVLQEVMKLSKSTIPSYIEIQQDIQPDCGMVMADSTQIHQVAMNIITNAYHSLEGSGGRISVTLRESELMSAESEKIDLRPGQFAVLSISDTGHGIPTELMDKIFEPYFTTKEKGKGTGLGLAVAYGIIREHRGNIRIDTEIGKGTTFTVYLPLMEKSEGVKSIDTDEEWVGGNERILLVDDDETVATLEKQVLERMGYKVASRLHSIEALEAFKASPDAYDLVITDMSMPKMTGIQLTEALLLIRPDIPIIICTGFSEQLTEENVDSFGLKGILMKPIVGRKMAQTVRKVLDEAKA